MAGIKASGASCLFASLMTVLHLGKLDFDAPASNSEGSEVAAKGEDALMKVCNLLEVQAAGLTEALCTKTMKAPGEGIIMSPVPCEGC